METEMNTVGFIGICPFSGLGLTCWLLVRHERTKKNMETTYSWAVLGVLYRGYYRVVHVRLVSDHVSRLPIRAPD